MSGPEKDRGGDAFDDFFGDPSPSGRMSPVPDEAEAAPSAGTGPDDEPTQDVDLRRQAAASDPGPTRPVEPAPVITPEPTPQGAVPEDWWQSDPAPAPTAAPHSSTWGPAPASAATPSEQQPVHHQPSYVQEPAPRRSVSPLAMVGMLVGGVLLGGLCVGGTVMAMGSDDDQPAASQKTVTAPGTQDPPATSTTPPPTSSSSTSTSKSSSSSPTRSGTLPAGATKCYGPKQGTSVGRGTDVTSCAFASAVRDAYLAEKPKDGRASLEVRSPVTKKNYTMTCTGAAVTRCAGGNDAVVVLY